MSVEIYPLAPTLRPQSARLAKYSICIADLIVYIFSSIAANLLIRSTGPYDVYLESTQGFEFTRLSFVFFAMLSIVYFAWKLRHYGHSKTFVTEINEIIKTVSIVAVLHLSMMALTREHFSRAMWIASWGFALILIPLGRWIAKTVLRQLGMWNKPTLIVGVGENAIEALLAIQSQPLMGMKVVGFVTPYQDIPESMLRGIRIFKGLSRDILQKLGEVHVVIALEHEERNLRDQWIRSLTRDGVREVSVIPAMRGVPLYGAEISHFFSHEVLMLRVRNNLAHWSARLVKRVFDLVVSSFLLVSASPIFAYLFFRVKKDGGKAFFGHLRIGQDGRAFKCYKFRSMVPNATEVLRKLLDENAEARAEWAKDFKLKNDPRITPIGRLLRKTSLDELPQLWNVFKGDMSLVGPRPVVSEELERYAENSEYYCLVKPGITGLWQISGRNDIDYSTRIYLDAWYVKNWSLWYDISILFKTIAVVLGKHGAY